MAEATSSDNQPQPVDTSPQPPPKKRPSLSLKKRRRIVPVEDAVLEESKQAIIPKNTVKATAWAIRAFEQWQTEHNEVSDTKCPQDVLTKEASVLAHWLCVFVSEIRKSDGQEYTPRSLSQILGGIQRYINEKRPPDQWLRICDPHNPHFKQVHQVLDHRFRDLHTKGIGTTRRQSDIISLAEESMLWDTGVMGRDTPSGLLNAVFFYNGLNFVLRGGEEHRKLRLSQLSFEDNVPDPENPEKFLACVKYTEHGSKNRPGGRLQLNVENKVVTQYGRPELGDRCHVSLLKLYFSKLTLIAFQRDIFYWKPRKELPSTPDEPWFTANVLGHNSLDKCLKNMFSVAGISSSNKSNHSLRATAISRMMDKQVPSKVIMERSGHLSKDGLIPYERTTPAQQHFTSNALTDVTHNKNNSDAKKKLPENPPKKECQALYSEAECPTSGEDNQTVLKGMSFHDMEGCTITINFNSK